MEHAGVALSFVAMLCWGFGDFLIQRATRKIGDWETLFAVCFFGMVILFPFVWREIPALFLNSPGVFVLVLCSSVLFLAALLDFEALKEGKLSVVEPIWSFEIITSAVLAFVVLKESISVLQITLITLLIFGLVLVSFRNKKFSRHFLLEKGVLIALAAAILMGCANFLVGWGARLTSAVMVNFFLNVFIIFGTLIYLGYRGELKLTARNIIANRTLLLAMSIFDNLAWIAFAFAMTLTSIAVATALSESYIIVAVLLGLWVNKERLNSHQKIGLLVALASAIILASVTV